MLYVYVGYAPQPPMTYEHNNRVYGTGNGTKVRVRGQCKTIDAERAHKIEMTAAATRQRRA